MTSTERLERASLVVALAAALVALAAAALEVAVAVDALTAD